MSQNFYLEKSSFYASVCQIFSKWLGLHQIMFKSIRTMSFTYPPQKIFQLFVYKMWLQWCCNILHCHFVVFQKNLNGDYVRNPFKFSPLLRACYNSNQRVLSIAKFCFHPPFFPFFLICRPKHLKKQPENSSLQR